jgi:hypothetical protein
MIMRPFEGSCKILQRNVSDVSTYSYFASNHERFSGPSMGAAGGLKLDLISVFRQSYTVVRSVCCDFTIGFSGSWVDRG